MEMSTTATTKTNGHILKERAPLCLKGRQDVHFVDQKTVIILYIVISYKHNGGQIVLIVYTIYRCGKEDIFILICIPSHFLSFYLVS